MASREALRQHIPLRPVLFERKIHAPNLLDGISILVSSGIWVKYESNNGSEAVGEPIKDGSAQMRRQSAIGVVQPMLRNAYAMVFTEGTRVFYHFGAGGFCLPATAESTAL
jgi:hypothetical protein